MNAATYVFDTDSGGVSERRVVATDTSPPITLLLPVPAVAGVSFTTIVLADGTRQFRFFGDLNFSSGDRVEAVGSRPLSLFAGGNLTIPEGVTFDVAADGRVPGVGGGLGGVAPGTGGASGGAGPGATPSELAGRGGAGDEPLCPASPTLCIVGPGHVGSPGASGAAGSPGSNGGAGASGQAGLPGINNLVVLGGQSGGGGGAAGVNGVGGAGGGAGMPGAAGSGGASSLAGGTGGNGGDGGGGEPGGAGGAGGTGTAGRNTGVGWLLSGGGGGGAGGSGGGGGGGGGGGSGGSGGGGGGGGSHDAGFSPGSPRYLDGGDGGDAGGGGMAGMGAAGGAGGAGGHGGGGGGAIELAARGRVVLSGMVDARGANGEAGTPGSNGAPGGSGAPGGEGIAGTLGQAGPSVVTIVNGAIVSLRIRGGAGGDGGDGGHGGDGGRGGDGGDGGHGGAGAGGTVRISGSSVVMASGEVLLAGGAGGDGGRFQLATNTATNTSGVLGEADSVAAAGERRVNPFIEHQATATPLMIEGLASPEAFGLAGATTGDIAAPADALVALERIDFIGDDFVGFDVLQVTNLGSAPLVAPRLGIELDRGDTGFLQALLAGGLFSDAEFLPGTAGPLALTELAPGALYRTLVPDGDVTVNFAYADVSYLGIALEPGALHYLTAAPIPAPPSVLLLLAGLPALLGRVALRRAQPVAPSGQAS